jgi:uncharacterized protein DUF4922
VREPANPIAQQLEDLYRRQIKTWPRLAKGVEGLSHAETRPVEIDWFEVYVRHIPHRVTSTTAAVDPDSIAKRPCFLCVENLDPEEEGIPFGDDFTIYYNPFPIVDRHLTIVHKEHRAQRIAHAYGRMLDLAEALHGFFVIYNGPECGASAPDHLHFQAGSRTLFPIEEDAGCIRDTTVEVYARNAFVFREGDRGAMLDRMYLLMDLLKDLDRKKPEPLINIAALYKAEEWTVYMFPRAKHRPEVFYTGELTVSPASIDLCGIFVVPLAKDFVRITGDMIRSIFKEVTLPDDQVDEIGLKLRRSL